MVLLVKVGFSFKPADAKTGVYMDVRYADLSPEVKINGTKFDLDLNPMVYTLGI